jgi:hypothetical protein
LRDSTEGRESVETWQEADETAIVFDNGGGQIVAGDLARDSTEGRESVDVTAGEGFEALAVSELDIQHPAVRIDEREGIQLPHVARVAECAEVAPVDFESFSGQRFHADESPFGSDVWAHIAHVLPQDAVTSLISRSVELLLDDGSAHAGIFLQPFGDSALEWIELAFAVPQFSAADGYARRPRGTSRGTVSSNRDGVRAIYADCPGTLRGIPGRRRSSLCGNRCGAFAGTRLRCRLPGGAGTSMAGKPADSSDNAVHPYGRCRISLPQI